MGSNGKPQKPVQFTAKPNKPSLLEASAGGYQRGMETFGSRTHWSCGLWARCGQGVGEARIPSPNSSGSA